jgi:hypothetical protein
MLSQLHVLRSSEREYDFVKYQLGMMYKKAVVAYFNVSS